MRDSDGAGRGVIARIFPEKTILVRSKSGLHCHHLRPRAQLAALLAAAVIGAWTVSATGLIALKTYAEVEETAAAEAIFAAYEARIAEAVELRRAAEQAAAEEAGRAQAAAEALAERHDAFTRALASERSAVAEAAALRVRTDALSRDRAALEAQVATYQAKDGDALNQLAAVEGERDELALTLERVAAALNEAAHDRDDAQALAGQVETALSTLEAGLAAERDSQAQLLAQLEEAATLSIGPLEDMLRTAGVDLDNILTDLRREDGGAGGPFVPAPEADAAVEAIGEARVRSVMGTLERISLLRQAANRMPFARPIGAARITSAYGGRRDPINGRRAVHEGLDFAGPRGSAVLAGASGEVVFSGRMNGYGNVVKIRHDFGFETLYAHLDRRRVTVGQRVDSGDRIGDLGNTGRSTGPHLHYEVRVNGRPVDPYKFIKAAHDVL